MDFNRELLRALERGAVNAEVKSIIEESNLYHTVDKSGFSLLHYCAQYNNVEITKYLLDRGCDVDIQTQIEGFTPLMLALRVTHVHDGLDNRFYPVVQALLNAGADIDMLNNEGISALEYVFQMFPSEEILQAMFHELRKKYPSDDKAAQRLIDSNCPLGHAVYAKDAKLIKCMFEKGSVLNPEDRDFGTELHTAVYLGDPDTVEVLLEHGANVRAIDQEGATPLYYLYSRNVDGHHDEKLEILRSLLCRGAPLTSLTLTGFFQIIHTLTSGDCKVVRNVLLHIENFDARDFLGRTVLHYLVRNPKFLVYIELNAYSKHFNVNALDHSGASPLSFAIRQNRLTAAMMKFLLDQGAEVNRSLINVYSVFDAKLKDRYDEWAEILLQHNADPQTVVEINGQTTTIFDNASQVPIMSDRMNFAIARLALLDKQGGTITELIRSKIDSHLPFKEYFENCKRVLDEKIFGTVTLFKLLTANKKRLANYLKNDELILKLTRMQYKLKVTSVYRFYYITLKKSASDALLYKTLREKDCRIISKLADNQLDENALILEQIMDYLDVQDLLELFKSFKDLL